MRDAILNRVSTRTFIKEEFTMKNIAKIDSILKELSLKKGPFGNSFEFTFSLNTNKDGKGQKIGTYGLLKNVPAYVGGVCENTLESIVDFGYVFEHIILELTEIGYGTCWLGGTFKRKDYRRNLNENQIIPAISPIGHTASKRSFVDRMLRKSAQSDNRLDDSKMFFDYDTLQPLGENGSIEIKQSLCLIRRGPSASNKQPWRVYVENQVAHFYIERTPGYAKPLHYDIQAIDMGIALAHYDIGLQFFNKKPLFKSVDAKDIEGKEYILSVQY